MIGWGEGEGGLKAKTTTPKSNCINLFRDLLSADPTQKLEIKVNFKANYNSVKKNFKHLNFDK